MPAATTLRLLSFTAALAFAAGAQAQTIGEVERLAVWGYGTPPGGSRGDLFRGSPVASGELVETVRGGEMLILFVDGTTLGLGGSSAMVLDELVFDPNSTDVMQIQLTQGFFHFVTGDIDKEAVEIVTPSMVIGVRGTDLAISVGDDGSTELGVRDGTATAAPAADGTPVGDRVDVAAGNTASAAVGDKAVAVSPGLSGAASGAMPGSGVGPGTGSPSSSGGGNTADNERGYSSSYH